MKISTITLEYLSNYKSNSFIEITCDSCSSTIHRKVKEVKRCVKNGQTNAYCSNICQGKSEKIILKDKKCKHCSEIFTPNFKESLFCSRTCAGQNRKQTDETKSKISKTLTGKHRSKFPVIGHYKYCENEYSTLYICTCKTCNFVGSYRTSKRYCKNCEDCYTENGRAKYIFTFNVYHYPNIFDLDLLKTHGWRKTKGDNININGVSRDHKVSVRDAIKYNYNPYYIKHPINCELMLHSDNQIKGTKSSLSYEELVKLVDEYDSSK